MEYISGAITLQSIFVSYWRLYLAWYQGDIRKAVIENVEKILKCRTPQLGFHLYQCSKCSEVRLVPHSCKSRFCSSCGKVATDRWADERLSDVLACGYHHLVFTLPWQLRAIIIENRTIMLQLLFKSVSKSIQDWTRQYGNYIPGFYIVLHTFGSDLKFHPHFHVLITAGGLCVDKTKWIHAPNDFLMPEKGLKKRFRFNVIKEIINANNRNDLKMPFLVRKNEYLNIRGIVSVISKLCWYIYIGARLLEIGINIRYIGRYTKKPAIAETRILNVTSKWVIFRFKDYAEGGVPSVKKMGLFTFITYLTQHIPDKFFKVVRGYGLFSNRLRGQLLPIARKFLHQDHKFGKIHYLNWRERKIASTNKDPLICDNCQIEMNLIFHCFKPAYGWLRKIGLSEYDKIPSHQLKLKLDTS